MINTRTTVLNPDFAHWVEELYKAARDLAEAAEGVEPYRLSAEIKMVVRALDNVSEYLGP